MATSAQVIAFLDSKGPAGARFTEIQRFIVTTNGLDFDEKDRNGGRRYRGYWTDRLLGSFYNRNGLLDQIAFKNGKHYVLKKHAVQSDTTTANVFAAAQKSWDDGMAKAAMMMCGVDPKQNFASVAKTLTVCETCGLPPTATCAFCKPAPVTAPRKMTIKVS